MKRTDEYEELSLLLKEALYLKQEILGCPYIGMYEIMRLYLANPVSDYFVYDNRSNCDVGHEPNYDKIKPHRTYHMRRHIYK